MVIIVIAIIIMGRSKGPPPRVKEGRIKKLGIRRIGVTFEARPESYSNYDIPREIAPPRLEAEADIPLDDGSSSAFLRPSPLHASTSVRKNAISLRGIILQQ